MAINSKFITSPVLQSYFVDKDTGNPLSAGIVTFYKDESRLELKPVYQISGSPPNYSFVALPNPMILSDVGTFQDDNSNDIVPYFYPYQGTPEEESDTVELYYITVESSGEVLQFTREGIPSSESQGISEEEFKNYIPNGQFLAYNNLTETDNIIPAGRTSIAPGGFYFIKPDSSVIEDTLIFQTVGTDFTGAPGFPRRILNLELGSGENPKDIRIQWRDVNKFSSDTQVYTFFFYAKSTTVSSYNVDVRLIKNFGTGGSSTTDILEDTLLITTSWEQHAVSIIFGDNTGKTIGDLDDDYVEIALRFPGNISTSLTDFGMAFGDVIIESFPVTTDAETLSQSVAGWMDNPNPDGYTLGLPLVSTQEGLKFDDSDIGIIKASGSDRLPEYHLWADGAKYETDVYNTDTGVPYRRLFNKLFSPITGGSIWGTGYDFATMYHIDSGSQNIVALSNNNGGNVALTTDGGTGMSFTPMTPAGGLVTNVKGYVALSGSQVIAQNSVKGINLSSPDAATSGFTIVNIRDDFNFYSVFTVLTTVATSLAGKYFLFSSTTANYYIWFKVDGTGSDPAVGGRTGIELDVSAVFTAQEVARVVARAIGGANITLFVMSDAASIDNGSYFKFTTTDGVYAFWYNKDNSGVAPVIASTTLIEVPITTGQTNIQVANATIVAINSKYFQTPDLRGAVLRGVDRMLGVDLDIGMRYGNFPFVSTDSGLGTWQLDQVIGHSHSYFQPSGTINIDAEGTDVTTHIASLSYTGNPNSGATGTSTSDINGSETRMYNAAVNYIIRY